MFIWKQKSIEFHLLASPRNSTTVITLMTVHIFEWSQRIRYGGKTRIFWQTHLIQNVLLALRALKYDKKVIHRYILRVSQTSMVCSLHVKVCLVSKEKYLHVNTKLHNIEVHNFYEHSFTKSMCSDHVGFIYFTHFFDLFPQ